MVATITGVSDRIIHPHHTPMEIKKCYFLELIDDILLYLATHFLARQDVRRLTTVSRRLRGLLIPCLYSQVRLILRRVDDLSLAYVNNRDAVLHQQKRLRSNLKKYPELNSHVRSLEWYLDSRGARETFLNLISPMQNLESLYVCTPYGSPWSTDPVPSSLPKCRKIIFEGIVSEDFAKLLIHPKLEVLGLDFTPRWALPILDWMATSPRSFPSLTTLELKFPGGREQSADAQIKLLNAWREVLLAFRTTLKEIAVLQRITTRDYFHINMIQPPSEKLLNSVLYIFGEHEWPQLRKLRLSGCPTMKGNQHRLDEFRCSIPEIVIDTKLDYSDYLWHNKFAYNPMLR